MKQLQDGLQYDLDLNPDFGNFLIDAGFKTNYQGNLLFFRNEKIRLQIGNKNIDVFRYYPEISAKSENEKWIFDKSFFNYANMNLFQFMMLMHSMNIVDLKAYALHAETINAQVALQAKMLLTLLIKTEIQAPEPMPA